MKHLDDYLATIQNDAMRDSIKKTALVFLDKRAALPSDWQAWYALLLGHVQSGKTGQLLGVISALADASVTTFILLTTDNRLLHLQTLNRVREALANVLIIGETDDVPFMTAPKQAPVVVVLKKNSRVLKTWRNTILSTERCKDAPLVIVDDEADATSLNTKVNVNSTSRINKLLGDIRDESSRCLYIQVTATPQAILLQSSVSGWRPHFVVTIPTGKGYLGGRYYFTDPPSHAVRFTSENEAHNIIQKTAEEVKGLVSSMFSYLVNCGEEICKGGACCNFLVHPSVRVECHKSFVERITDYISRLKQIAATPSFEAHLKDAWLDLQSTYPEIHSFKRIQATVVNLLKNGTINVFSVNSQSDGNVSYGTGFNIVVGGNSLGRGLTLPRLQVFYYCRTAKKPQADTMWQHSRMFGYDRVRGLVRVYIPKLVHKLFYDISESTEVLFDQIREKGIAGIQLILPEGLSPTRKCVIDRGLLSLVQGGVNFFPFEPDESNASAMDALLSNVDSREPITVSANFMLEVFGALGMYADDDWNKARFVQCLEATSKTPSEISCKLIVRRNRDISKATGSLLSETDRQLVNELSNDVVLVLYRLNGSVSCGWQGHSFWIPNIKFPDRFVYYSEK